MKQDRFLLGIVIGIVVIIIIALGVFFTRRTTVMSYQADDTPEQVVHNYILALRNKDYSRAYGYLIDGDEKPTLAAFKQYLLMNDQQIQNAIVDFGETHIDSTSAIVELTALDGMNDGIFSSGYENKSNVLLEKINGEWKISNIPFYMFWSYDWYQNIYSK